MGGLGLGEVGREGSWVSQWIHPLHLRSAWGWAEDPSGRHVVKRSGCNWQLKPLNKNTKAKIHKPKCIKVQLPTINFQGPYVSFKAARNVSDCFCLLKHLGILTAVVPCSRPGTARGYPSPASRNSPAHTPEKKTYHPRSSMSIYIIYIYIYVCVSLYKWIYIYIHLYKTTYGMSNLHWGSPFYITKYMTWNHMDALQHANPPVWFG